MFLKMISDDEQDQNLDSNHTIQLRIDIYNKLISDAFFNSSNEKKMSIKRIDKDKLKHLNEDLFLLEKIECKLIHINSRFKTVSSNRSEVSKVD